MKVICIKDTPINKLIIVDDSLNLDFVHKYYIRRHGSYDILFKSDKINWNKDEFKLFLLGSNFRILHFHESILPSEFVINNYYNKYNKYIHYTELNKNNIKEFYSCFKELMILWNNNKDILGVQTVALNYLNENILEIDKIINEQIIEEII
jgi:hypothetical protein